MKTLLNTLLLISLLGSQILSAVPPRRLGWIGDAPGKPMPSVAPSQWPIKIPATEAEVQNLIKVLDQGQIGSCVAHGTLEAWDLAFFLITGKHLLLSRLQVYYEARRKEGTVNSDSGCQIVDAVSILQKIGAGDEKLWKYDTSKFRVKPPLKAYTDGKKHIAIQAFKVDNTDGVSIRLAITNGYPVIVGSLVYRGIMTLDKNNYILPMPKPGEHYIGGHCYLVKGYRIINGKLYYICRNSWSEDYGLKGDFYAPKEYIESGRITEDCWVIPVVMK